MSDRPGFGADDIERVARRVVDLVLDLVRRGRALAGGVLAIALVCCVAGFLLGLAALSGGIRAVWIVVGGFFLIVGVGAVVVAIRRLGAVRRAAQQLVDDVRTLITGDQGTERVVIETIESGERSESESVVVLSQQFSGMRGAVRNRPDLRAISSALRAVTTFPLLIAITTVVSLVFAFLGLLFLIALAL